MRFRTRRNSPGGFALVLTLALMALLVLAVAALGTLVRVNGEISSAGTDRTRARQHALVGLAQALGRLQTSAGADDRVTAMAGVVSEADGSPRRHWCGVWDGAGHFLGWLASGAESSAAPRLAVTRTVTLVGAHTVGGSVGAPDEEFVDVGKVSIDGPARNGGSQEMGAYAFWVGDEGVKVSAFAPEADLPPDGLRVGVSSRPASLTRIGSAYQQFDVARAASVLAWEQGRFLAYAAAATLPLESLQYGFHHLTLTHRSVGPDGTSYRTGRVNLNTNSEAVWRSLFESYEASPEAKPFGSATRRTQAIRTVVRGLTAGAPFLSVDSFLDGDLLATAVAGKSGIEPEAFAAAMRPMLTVRSDTFRIRAYGEAVNPVDAARKEAAVYCEAIVQRTPRFTAGGFGRRFEVVYFRWLGPDDL